MRKNFGQPHDRNILGVYQDLASGSLHLGATHAEKIRRGNKLFQRTDELSAVSVARGFACGK